TFVLALQANDEQRGPTPVSMAGAVEGNASRVKSGGLRQGRLRRRRRSSRAKSNRLRCFADFFPLEREETVEEDGEAADEQQGTPKITVHSLPNQIFVPQT